MGYLEDYRRRLLSKGSSNKERIEKNLAKDFEFYLKHSPGYVQFQSEGRTYEGVLISGTRTAAQSELKIVFNLRSRLQDRLNEGSLITTFDKTYDKTRYWVILNSEVKAYYGYIQYKILELDYILKYIDRNGVLREAPAFVMSTATFDIKEYFKFANDTVSQIPYRALNVIWPAHPEINISTKFMIGDEVWRYVDSDKISIPGLYYTTLYKTQLNTEEDSYNDQIANTSKLGNTKIISNYGEKSIVISKLTTNLTFELVRDGRIVPDSFTIIDNSEAPIVLIQKGQILPLKTGKTSLIVTDQISGYSELIELTVQDMISNYLYIVGDTVLPLELQRLFEINSDQKFSYSYDNNYMRIKQRDNFLEIVGTKIGNTEITIQTSSKVKKIPIKIVSTWG